MSKHRIVQLPGCTKMGTLASSRRALKKRDLKEIEVVGLDAYGNTLIHILADGGELVLRLSPTTSMQLVRAILENQADVTLCADEEFRRLINAKILAAEEDARQVVQAVKDYNKKIEKNHQRNVEYHKNADKDE